MELIDLDTVEHWRNWLAEHHNSESEVWLVFYKRGSGRESIDYLLALDQALCFGWVDSLIKRIDDARYARKFTPRKPDSRCSAVNRKRYEELKAAGKMAPAGLNRPPTERTYGPKPKLPLGVPLYIQKALKKYPDAAKHFKSLAPSHKQRYVLWIDSAKQEPTKVRRLQEAIRMLSAGQKLGLK